MHLLGYATNLIIVLLHYFRSRQLQLCLYMSCGAKFQSRVTLASLSPSILMAAVSLIHSASAY